MRKKYLIFVIVFLCAFFNIKMEAQAYKSDNIDFYTYIFPESYIPKAYHTYGVKINLPVNQTSVVIDGEKKGSRAALSFNALFTEKQLLNIIGNTPLLEFVYTDRQIESADHFIIDTSVKNVAYGADISENQSLETPFTYQVYYSYDVVFKIIDSHSKDVIREKTYSVKNKYTSDGYEGYIAGFKTKPEAVNYLVANIDKGLIFNEVVNNIRSYLRDYLDMWFDVIYSQDRCYFSRITKEDKNPLFLKLNQDVDAIEKWSRQKKEPILDDVLLSANAEFIQKNDLTIKKDQSMYFNDKTRLMNYKNFLDNKKVFTDFILKMDQYAKQLNPNDKGEKVALWACYTNIASSFALLGNYKCSLEYVQKARALNYQERQVKNIEDKMIERQNNHNVFFDTKGEIKEDINSRYLKYLTL